MAGAVEHLKPFLIGKDPFQIERLWQEMFRGGFFRPGNITTSAIAAIDIALWDIKGKALQRPDLRAVRRSGPRQDRLLSARAAGGSIEALVENAQQHVDEGWKFVRWGLGRSSSPRATASSRPAAVRRGHPRVRGATQGGRRRHRDRLRPPHPARSAGRHPVLSRVEQYRPFFIEDPIRAESMYSLRQVRAARQRAAGGRRAVPQQVGVPRDRRGGADGLRPHRHLHRRRPDRGEQDRGLVRDALHQAGDATTRSGQSRRRPARSSNLATSNVGVQEQPTQAVRAAAGRGARSRWSGRTATSTPPTRPGWASSSTASSRAREPVPDVRGAAPAADGRRHTPTGDGGARDEGRGTMRLPRPSPLIPRCSISCPRGWRRTRGARRSGGRRCAACRS